MYVRMQLFLHEQCTVPLTYQVFKCKMACSAVCGHCSTAALQLVGHLVSSPCTSGGVGGTQAVAGTLAT